MDVTTRFQNESEIIYGKLQKWYELATSMLPNFVLAIIIIIAFYFLARLFQWLTVRVFLRALKNNELKKIISKILYFLVMIIGLMTSLSVLELEKTVTSILASVGIIGLALGFAFQDIASNFISGFFMAVKKPFYVGDIVEVKDYQGTITHLNLRTTELRTFEGNDVIIPNKDIFQNPIVNYFTTAARRITVEVGVSYGEDLDHVREVTLKALKSLTFILPDKEPEVFFTGFGDSSINLDARFWVEYTHNSQFLSGKSEAIMAIKRAYDAEGITIPFPIRTLDFGIKGGEKLSDVIPKSGFGGSDPSDKPQKNVSAAKDQHLDPNFNPKKKRPFREEDHTNPSASEPAPKKERPDDKREEF